MSLPNVSKCDTQYVSRILAGEKAPLSDQFLLFTMNFYIQKSQEKINIICCPRESLPPQSCIKTEVISFWRHVYKLFLFCPSQQCFPTPIPTLSHHFTNVFEIKTLMLCPPASTSSCKMLPTFLVLAIISPNI